MDFLIPSRQKRPADDPIFSLNALAKEHIARGEDVVNATIGVLLHDDGRLAVMPSVVEALSKVDPAVAAAYAPIGGSVDFLAAVKHDLLGPYGLADKAISVATPGGSGALRMAVDDFLEPGQKLLTSSYFWSPYGTLSDEAGRKLETFNMFDARGRYDTAALDATLGALLETQGRALVFLNTPCHNPTGYSLDEQEWNDVIEILARRADQGPIIAMLDVAYAMYNARGLDIAIQSLLRVADKVQVLFAWSASKSFAQYGLRVGALVGLVNDPAARQRMSNAFVYSCRGMWSNCNAGGMAGITQVINDDRLRAAAIAERAELVNMLATRVTRWNELAQGSVIRYPRYQGGFFTTVFCNDPPAMAARLRERGVFVVPMRGAMRVALCSVNEPQIKRIVDSLIEVLS